MTRRLPYLTGLLLLAVALRGSPPLGAVVQTWTYDPLTNIVSVKILNASHKDITAFNIAIKETYSDGRVEQHELLEDFLGKIVVAKERQGDTSSGAESFRKLYGDGAFHPGEVRDEKLGVQPGLKDYQAVIDVVAYIDATAEATNNDALGRIVSERQATVASQKVVTEAIQNALADNSDSDPSTTAAAKLQDRAKVWKAQQNQKLDLDAGRLESVANELKGKKRDALKQFANREEGRLSLFSVHAALVKNGGQQ